MMIQFANWERFNPRKDRKSHSWFRFQNDFHLDPKFHRFTPAMKLVVVMLMCEVSRNGGRPTPIDAAWMADMSGVGVLEIQKTIRELTVRGVLVAPDGAQAVPDGAESAHYERTNGRTDEQLTTEPSRAPVATGPIGEFLVFGKTLSPISHDTQRRWLELYGEEFCTKEFLQMANWLEVNKHKAPKSTRGWSQFMSSWLQRSWERFRKSLPSQAAKGPGMMVPE